MSGIHRLIRSTSASAVSLTARAVRDPLAPYRAVKNIYAAPDGTPDIFEEMTLQEHLVEVRNRLMRIVIVILPLFVFGFLFASKVLVEIKDKANASQGLDVRSPTDPLTLTFKIAVYIALSIGMPVIVYQIVAFLSPGLTRQEKKILYTSLPFVSILFIAGAAYGYFVAAPRALFFLSTWNSHAFNWQPDGPETISFFLTLMVGLGISFQLPVIMFILAKIGIVTPRLMRRWRKYSILLIAVAAAVITPSTDPINMMIVAIPLYVLYEVGIIISSVFAKTSLRDFGEHRFGPS
ncbi:MAG: twin-arginine translocase subunit TatC [Thermomicrobiales bacterium]